MTMPRKVLQIVLSVGLLASIYIGGCGAWIHADLLDSSLLARLKQARSPNEIDGIRNEFHLLRVARLACQIQFDRDEAPTACYEALRREVQLHIHSAQETDTIENALDQACLRAAKRLRVSDWRISYEFLSPTCRLAMHDAKRAHDYRLPQHRRWSGS